MNHLFWQKNKIRKWTTGSFYQTPSLLSEPLVYKNILFLHLSLIDAWSLCKNKSALEAQDPWSTVQFNPPVFWREKCFWVGVIFLGGIIFFAGYFFRWACFFWGGGWVFFFFFFFFFWGGGVQYNTVQYSTVQYSTVQYSTVQ